MIVRNIFIAVVVSFGLSQTLSYAAPTDGDTVIVSRGTAKVTFADIDAYVQRIPEGERAGFMDSPKRIENLLDGLLLQSQLAQVARDNKLDQKPIVQQQLKLVQNELLSKQAMLDAEAKLKTPDMNSLAKETYATHKSDYLVKGQTDVKHILISIKSHSDEEAKKLAEDVEKQARANPQSFDDLVLKYSEDPSKGKNLGVMVDTQNTKYDPAFSAGAAKLAKEGEISAPVRTSFGYHILKLVKRTSDRQKSFEEVHDAVVATLAAQYKEQQMRAYSGNFASMPLDAKPELVESLRDRYMPGGPGVAAAAATAVKDKH